MTRHWHQSAPRKKGYTQQVFFLVHVLFPHLLDVMLCSTCFEEGLGTARAMSFS